jgi:hypothetical protein
MVELMVNHMVRYMIDKGRVVRWILNNWRNCKLMQVLIKRKIQLGWIVLLILTVSFCRAILFHLRELITIRELLSSPWGTWTMELHPIQVTQARWLTRELHVMLFITYILMDLNSQMLVKTLNQAHCTHMIKDSKTILFILLELNTLTSIKIYLTNQITLLENPKIIQEVKP